MKGWVVRWTLRDVNVFVYGFGASHSSMTKPPADVDKYIYVSELVLAIVGFLIMESLF